MDHKTKKYITASYRLYDITDGRKNLIEETSADRPFTFISGLGLLLEEFERQIIGLEAGSKFDFALTPEQAFGEHSSERVLDLDKQFFHVDGKFDQENVYRDAVIPLQDEDGNRFYGRVMEVTDEKVKIDLNHPLAGRTLNFCGEINENREATSEEVAQLTEKLSGRGSGCKCGGHGHQGECCGKHHHDEECGHHRHSDGECCGKHHNDGECCSK